MRRCNACHPPLVNLMLWAEVACWGICVRKKENEKNLGKVHCGVAPSAARFPFI